MERNDSAFCAHGWAVFSLDEGGATQLVVLQELEFRAEPDWEGLANRIRAAIAEEFDQSMQMKMEEDGERSMFMLTAQATRCRSCAWCGMTRFSHRLCGIHS